MKEVFRIFAYLKNNTNSELVFDPTENSFNKGADFPRKDWAYSIFNCDGADLMEILPPNMPKPRGKRMTMRVYVDADHAGDVLTCRSRSRFFVFLNNAPIYWSSKKQGSTEISTYASELVAMKEACEFVRGLRYKIRMMGILVEEPTFIYGDNQYVMCNTSDPGSTLKKKSNAMHSTSVMKRALEMSGGLLISIRTSTKQI